MNWRRLAATTAACLLNIHACRVYDETDLEGSSETIEGSGGRASMGTGGSLPPFPGNPAGSGGSRGGSPNGGSGATAAVAGRGGVATAGGIGGKPASGAHGGEPENTGGDPGGGAPGGSGGEAGDAAGGTTQAGGAPSGGNPTGGSGITTGGAATGGAPPVPPELIDDCEDRNNRIRANQERNGYWSTFDAGTGCTLSPLNSMGNTFMSETEDGSGTGKYALHFVSSGGTDGCGTTLEFLSPKEPYDASEYVGIAFGARTQGEAREIVVQISVAGTDPDFGLCGSSCYDHFETSVALTETWNEHVVRFENLAQEGWGFDAGDFDASQIVAIQWLAVPGTADIWIDDVKFVAD